MLNTNLIPLTSEQLMKMAPAVFAEAPHPELSDRYSFLRTADVIAALMGAGWAPVKAAQSFARVTSRADLQQHSIRFRHVDLNVPELSVNDMFAELMLSNSHDGTSAFRFDLGLFRKACMNGMCVSDSVFARISIPHRGVTKNEVVEAAFDSVKGLPKLTESISSMRSLMLTPGEQSAFAGAAAYARWGDAAPVEASTLLATRRTEDRPADLWTTFNKVQENVTRGGVRGRTPNGRRAKVRAIHSVNEDTRLNKALWSLAEEMRRLKGAA